MWLRIDTSSERIAHNLTSVVDGRRRFQGNTGARWNKVVEVGDDAIGIDKGMINMQGDGHRADHLVGIIDARGNAAVRPDGDHSVSIMEKRLEPGIIDITRPTDDMPQIVDAGGLTVNVARERAQVNHPEVLLPKESMLPASE